MTTSQRRLPGVRFEAPPSALREALPRMDIALFVGFAASGPVDLPVAVESLNEFEAVFGAEIVLARDVASGADVPGLLQPSVRGFFSQGGRRCWIVRVAAASAETARFPLAHMLLARRADAAVAWRFEPASIAARSPGSWADSMRVATRLQIRSVRLRPVRGGSPFAFDVEVLGSAALALRSGELLRFVVDNVGPVQARIDRVEPLGSDVAGRLRRRVHLRGALAAHQVPAATDIGAVIDVRGFSPIGSAAAAEEAAVAAEGGWDASGRFKLRCRVAADRLPGDGAVLAVRFAGSFGSAWFTVGDIVPTQSGAADGRDSVELTGTLWRIDGEVARASFDTWLADAGERPAQWLQLGLRAGTGDELDFTLDGLGMAAPIDAPGAGLGIANLPDDLAFFAADAGNGSAAPASTAFELTRRDTFGRLTRRFPLASIASSDERMLIALDVGQAFGPGLAAAVSDIPALQRDGLDDYSWRLFTEPSLDLAGSDAVADQAESLRMLDPDLRTLRGMHAAFGSGNSGIVDEPTLLAVPDAVHAGWRAVPDRQPAWTEWPLPVAAAAPASERDFSDCAATPLAAPQWLRGADPDVAGNYSLQWTEPEAGVAFELQEASDLGFALASLSYSGPAQRFAVVGKTPGSRFYRVRAMTGARLSPWSAALQISVGLRGYETLPWRRANLLAVHRAMLRTAAGRGDMLAVLALPQHYDFDDACAHAGSLRGADAARPDRAALPEAPLAPLPIGADETRALSHGAIYHPWLLTRRGERVLASPPDGAACGQLAAAALERGAWMAVANRPLRDVVAVSASASRAEMQNLLDAQVNLVRASPRGFVLSTADTLSPDADWRPVNVRRLMTLLRRLALRRGATYVFEPNGAVLRRTVERAFDAVLDELFRRGALAGADARSAYRVEVGDEVNTPARNDLGQFWVELKVAPALPLTFLTVRLARSGERLVAHETR